MASLNDLANRFGTDKGDFHHEKHNYAEIYDKILHEHRESPVNFVEIGINDPRFPGASIHMWKSYFKNGTYRGLDINIDQTIKQTVSILDKVYVYNVDQTNTEQLTEFASHIPAIDFVVDDGIHTHEAQMVSFKALFPYLRSGGIYFIEDCHAKDCVLTIEYFKLFGSKVLTYDEKIKGIELIDKVEFHNNNKLIVIYKA
jgi:demethylmacrocin O-methyltransferase